MEEWTPLNLIVILKKMKTYKELLEKLMTLSPEQLDSEIVVLADVFNTPMDAILNIEVHDQPLYKFKYTKDDTCFEFEDDENTEDYECEKILNSNYPVIELKIER